MVTPDDEPGREPIDPVYAALFRPEDVEPAEPEIEIEIGEAVDVLEPVLEPEPEPEPEPEAVPPAATAVDTGRLFRSQGVTDDTAAVLALTSDRGGKLRTLARTDVDPPVRVNSAAAAAGGAVIADDPDVRDDAPVRESRADRRRHQASRQIASSGITAGAVYVIILGVTLLVAFLNAWLGKGELGWPTGLALLISSVYCALRVRREDDVVAIFLPPIAFFLAAITAGQMFRGTSGGGLLNRVQLVFFTMAYNWYWVIGTTVVVVVIVLVRRRRV